jgi:hypothetical protein
MQLIGRGGLPLLASAPLYRERIHEVIRYGIYVSLGEIADWLDPLTL